MSSPGIRSAPALTSPDTVNTNPFPGLRPFHEDEEHLFFGRERQVDSMVDKLAKSHFLAVVGTSGSGKSSLVNCGLVPALHRGLMTRVGPVWRIAYLRPGRDPLRALTRALPSEEVLYSGYQGAIPLDEIVDTHLRMSKRGLIEIFRKARLPEQVNLLIVVDQFEELFRYRSVGAANAQNGYGASQDAIVFVNLLLEVPAQPAYPLYVVLTMRSDFLGDCSQFEGLPEAINDGQFLVPRLTREERRAAIAGPVGTADGEINPVLLTRLVNDVGDNPDQLSILQHALNRTWAWWENQEHAEGQISLPHYEAIGTMSQALDRHAEKAYGELAGERAQKICEKIFKALTDKGTDARGIRRPTALRTLCAIAGASQAEVTAVINVFRKPSRSFLMPPIKEALEPDTVIDISHESLMRVWERLKSWSDQEARSARMYRRLAETAALHKAGNAGLWGDPDLQLALDWQFQEQPNAAWADFYPGDFASAIDFLEKSKAERNREEAEFEFDGRWRKVALRFVVGLVMAFAVITKELVNVESVTNAVLNLFRLSSSSLAHVVVDFLVYTVCCIPYLLVYLGVATYGKKLFRSAAFPRILAGVTERHAKPKEEPRLVQALAPETTVNYAGFGWRLLAYLIDGIIFWATMIPFVAVGAEVGHDLLSVFMLAGYAVNCLYEARMTSSRWQATPGKRLTRITVTDVSGRRLSFRRAFARQIAKLLSYYSVVGIFLPLLTRKKQSIHDLVTRTVVVRSRKLGS